jgi:hypothetical protein
MNLIGRDGRTRRTDERTDNPAFDSTLHDLIKDYSEKYLWWLAEVLHNVGTLQRSTRKVLERKKTKFMYEEGGGLGGGGGGFCESWSTSGRHRKEWKMMCLRC